MKLAILSHTEHYQAGDQIVGWGPTVREINHLLEVFEEIWHVAVLLPGEAPASSLPYRSDRIHFVPIKPSGGPIWRDKLHALWQMPGVLNTVRQTLRQVDCFQFRAPTGIGNVLLPYLSLCCKKPGWFKYAGNWKQQPAPPGYRWQRWWLSHYQGRPVTMNGYWLDQAPHLHSFENPCLTEQEWKIAQERIQNKQFSAGMTLCFVGTLTANKGIRQLLKAILQTEKPVFEEILIAGDGPLRPELEALGRQSSIPVRFLGFQSREQLNEIYARSHFIALPSENEGFPKVIAEAAAYGCIPIVTDVSSIGQYVMEGKNGFLLPDNTVQSIRQKLEALREPPVDLLPISINARKMARLFTYERYLQRISSELIPLLES